ncbi:MAG: tripartite tricarboxylate transporter substrate binding protein [Pseudomonadota bacterium]|nr:tripartite tricarboxylate transporter substrate binding protein [Pseudomonadota bacterium]
MKAPALYFRLVVTMFCVYAHQAGAQTVPPLRGQIVIIVVPFAAGGNVDIGARLMAAKLGEQLQATVVVENKVGASGTLGTQYVARAKPDGTTLLFTPVSPISVVPMVSPSIVRYDSDKDLTVIGPVSTSPFVVVGRSDFPASTAAQLVKVVRQQPGKFSLGTDGTGTGLHLAAEMVKRSAGLDLLHVPYKSGVQVMTELVGGQIDLAVLPVALAQGFVQNHKVKAFGVTSAQPWPTLPQVPPLSSVPEFRGIEIESWQALFAPAQVPKLVVESLRRALAETMADPELSHKMTAAGLSPMHMGADEFESYIRRERSALAKAVAGAGIKPE